MGTHDTFLDKTERICGNLRATGHKQARLDISVEVFPYCEKQPSVVAFPEVKVAVGQQAQGLAYILQHVGFLLGTRNVNPQLDSHWRHLFRRTTPKAEDPNPNCFFVADDFSGTGDGRTVIASDPSLKEPAYECVVLAVKNLAHFQKPNTTMNVQRRTHSQSLGIRESRSPSNERPRSRAIRIKRTNNANVNVDDLEEIHGDGDGMYDWATWRMYNRIIDHRQKYPVKLNEDTSINVGQNSQFASPHWNRSSGGHGNDLLACEATMPNQHSDYSPEGEVFEFDP